MARTLTIIAIFVAVLSLSPTVAVADTFTLGGTPVIAGNVHSDQSVPSPDGVILETRWREILSLSQPGWYFGLESFDMYDFIGNNNADNGDVFYGSLPLEFRIATGQSTNEYFDPSSTTGTTGLSGEILLTSISFGMTDFNGNPDRIATLSLAGVFNNLVVGDPLFNTFVDGGDFLITLISVDKNGKQDFAIKYNDHVFGNGGAGSVNFLIGGVAEGGEGGPGGEVPEPATMLLLGGGLLAAAGARARRRRQS